MKRLKQLVIIFQGYVKLILTVCLFSLSSVNAAEFREFEDFNVVSLNSKQKKVLDKHYSLSNKNKVQVITFFSYGCYWCSQINDPIFDWVDKHSDKVEYFKYPVGFNKLSRELGKFYYIARDTGQEQKMDRVIFDATHIRRMRVWKPEVMKEILQNEASLASADFDKKYNSEDLENKVDFAGEMADAFDIVATPVIIISGPKGIYSTTLAKTRGKDKLMDVISYLVKQQQL